MATVIAPAVAFGDRTVTARYFGTGNASRTIWNLACMDSDRALLAPVIYRKDWQMPGHYQLYSTSRTNLVLQSQTFNVAGWAVAGAGTGVAPTLTGNYGVAPDGTTTAERLQFNKGAGTTSGDYSYLFQGGLAGPDPTVISFWAKSTDGTSSYVLRVINGSNSSGGNFTVTGTWQRFTVQTNGAFGSIYFMSRGDVPTSQTADVLIWGVQVESGTVATPYIPTTTAAASVTDYSTDANGKVTFAAAPVLAADLAYLDPWMGTACYKSFGTGDGVNTQFSLPWKPVTPSIYKDGVLQTLTTHYTVTPGGVITWVTAPGNGTVLTWTGNMGEQR